MKHAADVTVRDLCKARVTKTTAVELCRSHLRIEVPTW